MGMFDDLMDPPKTASGGLFDDLMEPPAPAPASDPGLLSRLGTTASAITKGIGLGLSPTALGGHAARVFESGTPSASVNTLDTLRQGADQQMEAYLASPDAQQPALFGTKGEWVRDIAPNLPQVAEGFAGMAAGAAMGAPLGPAGSLAGGVVGGLLPLIPAYHESKTRSALDITAAEDARRMRAGQPAMTQPERVALENQAQSDIRTMSAAEVGTELPGQIAETAMTLNPWLKLGTGLTKPIAKVLSAEAAKAFAGAGAKAAATTALTEPLEETASRMIQQPIETKYGVSEGQPYSMTDPADWLAAAKDVTPGTLRGMAPNILLSGGVAGTGAVRSGRKAYQRTLDTAANPPLPPGWAPPGAPYVDQTLSEAPAGLGGTTESNRDTAGSDPRAASVDPAATPEPPIDAGTPAPAQPGGSLGIPEGLRGPMAGTPPGALQPDVAPVSRPAVNVPLTAAPEDAAEEIDLLKGPKAPRDIAQAPLSALAPQYIPGFGLTPGAPVSPQLPPEAPQLRSDGPQWRSPTATDVPNPDAIVRNRTIGPGLGLGAVIDAQTGVGMPRVPVQGQSWGWDKPGSQEMIPAGKVVMRPDGQWGVVEVTTGQFWRAANKQDAEHMASAWVPASSAVPPEAPFAPDVRQDATPPTAAQVTYEPGVVANTFHLRGNADEIQATLKAAGLPIGSRLDDGTVRLNELVRAKVEGVFPPTAQTAPDSATTPAQSAPRPVYRFQWMRNKEGGQTSGNQQMIVPVDAESWPMVTPMLRPDIAKKGLKAYQKANKNPYVSLVSKDNGATWKPSGVGQMSDLVPSPPDPRWVKPVDSFDSDEARSQAAMADSDLPKAPQPGGQPPPPTTKEQANGQEEAEAETLLSPFYRVVGIEGKKEAVPVPDGKAIDLEDAPTGYSFYVMPAPKDDADMYENYAGRRQRITHWVINAESGTKLAQGFSEHEAIANAQRMIDKHKDEFADAVTKTGQHIKDGKLINEPYRVTAKPKAPAETPAEPSKLTQFRNDLIEVRSRIKEQGGVVNDRLLERERQLVKVIKELEAEEAQAQQPPPSNTAEYINHAKFVASVIDDYRQRGFSVATDRTNPNVRTVSFDGTNDVVLVTRSDTKPGSTGYQASVKGKSGHSVPGVSFQYAMEWAANYLNDAKKAEQKPADVPETNFGNMPKVLKSRDISKAAAIAHLKAGGRIEDGNGTQHWISKVERGTAGNTWVVNDKDADSEFSGQKGPGPYGQWGPDEAAQKVLERVFDWPEEAGTMPPEPMPAPEQNAVPEKRKPYRGSITQERNRIQKERKRLSIAADFAYDTAVNDKGGRVRQIEREQAALELQADDVTAAEILAEGKKPNFASKAELKRFVETYDQIAALYSDDEVAAITGRPKALTPQPDLNEALRARHQKMVEQLNALADRAMTAGDGRLSGNIRSDASRISWTDAKIADPDWVEKYVASRESLVKGAERKVKKPAEAPKPPQETAPQETTTAPFGSTNVVFTQSAADAARERLRKKLGTVRAGLDPEMVQDGILLAGFYIEGGVREFGAWSKRMLDDLGEAARPYLRSWYEGVRYYPGIDAAGMSSAAEIEAQTQETAPPADNQDAKAAEQDDVTERPGTAADDRTGDEGQRPGPVSQPQPKGRTGVVRGAKGGTDTGTDRGTGNAAVDAGAGVEDGGTGAGAGSERDTADDAGTSAGERSGVRARGHDYRIQPGELTRQGSWLETARRNVDAVELIANLEKEQRLPTQEEQAVLVQFTGWGPGEIRNNLFPPNAGTGKNYRPYYLRGEWQKLGERVADVFSEDDWRTVARSTQYAHYTSEKVIRSIYAGLERLGFGGGSVVEPGAGIGLFAGLMPEGMYTNSSYLGIELDGFSAKIAKALFPSQSIRNEDFTRQKLPRNLFDAAIGNPPFADIRVLSDPDYKKQKFLLHDYFFAKTLDSVRPGGLLVFVTSNGTMDKKTTVARDYLSERADLLGAIRLPQTAFKANAGTEVVTDVLFLRKREPGAAPGGAAWKESKPIEIDGTQQSINEYYLDHPEMVLGVNSSEGTMYAGKSYTVKPLEGDIEDHFAKAVLNLPENVYSTATPRTTTKTQRTTAAEREFNPNHKKEGGVYANKDGELMRVERGVGVPLVEAAPKLKPNQHVVLKDYLPLRDALKRAYYDQLHDGDWQKSLKELNRQYDAFVKKHGQLMTYTTTERKTVDEDGVEQIVSSDRYKYWSTLSADVEFTTVWALETKREDGAIVKGPALKDRVLKRPTTPKVENIADALAVTLAETGAFDLGQVARAYGVSEDEAIAELGELIYEQPDGGWVMADEYLSGDVRGKLDAARIAAHASKRYERNVKALEAVQPALLGVGDISVKLGAAWVVSDYVADFASNVLKIANAKVTYNEALGSWVVVGGVGKFVSRSGSAEWGTSRRSPTELLDAILNNRTIRIMDTVEEGKSKKQVFNEVETVAANDMAKRINDEFISWLWQDSKRAADLLALYNERFNRYSPREFNGDHINPPGMSLKFKLHPHQKRAIWRQVQTGNTYLAHAVGAGKTLEMIIGGMEQKRLGLINKPMYVVPNHMLGQFAREFVEAYPAANILVADEENFHKENRQRFVAQAALNNPDAVVITHSAFKLLSLTPENRRATYEDIIEDLRDQLSELDEDDQTQKRTRSQIEKRIERLEQLMEGKAAEGDVALNFEDLGVDFLYVDEAHAFRKLDFATNLNVKGLSPAGSVGALDLFAKTRWLNKQRPGRAFVFASGTPITNSMAEMYSVQRFFQDDLMRREGIHHFDAWANMFGRVAKFYERNATGNIEVVERFGKFVNVYDMMSRALEFMDVLTTPQLAGLIKVPDVKEGNAGRREIVTVPQSDNLVDYLTGPLAARLEASRAWKPSKEEPNNPDPVIAIITDGRLAAIDFRFVEPGLKDDPGSKLNRMCDEIIRIHKDTAKAEYTDPMTGKKDPVKGSTQIVFASNGFGEGVIKNRGFDSRAHVMRRIKAAGIPADQVAWIWDYKDANKKEELFKRVRQGKVRILIGSPKNMGTGVNVQRRLIALHHLDAPWYPADLEQPEGRIVRQGNQNGEVAIYGYAADGTYDSTMWSMVARKSGFIEQAFKGDRRLRVIDDISESSQYALAAAIASGDPRYMQLAELETDVTRLETLRKAHADRQRSIEWDIGMKERNLEHWQAQLVVAQRIEKALGDERFYSGYLSGTVGDQTFKNATTGEVSAALTAALNAARDAEVLAVAQKAKGKKTRVNHEATRKLGTINGVDIEMEAIIAAKENDKGDVEYLVIGSNFEVLAIKNGDKISSLHQGFSPPDSPDRIGQAFTRTVGAAQRGADAVRGRIKEQKEELADLLSRRTAPFGQEQEYLEKQAELEALRAELTGKKDDLTAGQLGVGPPSEWEAPTFTNRPTTPLQRVIERAAGLRREKTPATGQTWEWAKPETAQRGPRYSAGTSQTVRGELVGTDGATYRGVRAPGAPDLDLERTDTGGVPFITGHSITRDEYEALDAGRVDGLFRLSTRGPETTGYQGWFLDLRATGRTVDYRTGQRIEPPANLVALMDRVRATRDRVGFHYDGRKGSPIEVRVQRRGTEQPANLYAGGSGFSDDNIRRNRELMGGIRKVLAEVAPGATVRFADRMVATGDTIERSGGTQGAFAAGSYNPLSAVVQIAMNYRDPTSTAYHEAIHFLKASGLFKESEWKALEGEARRTWAKRYGVTDTEEAIAYGAADFLRATDGGKSGYARQALAVLKRFFERLAAWLRGQGFQTWDDVLRRVGSGQVGARNLPRQTGAMVPALASAGTKTAPMFFSALRAEVAKLPAKTQSAGGWLTNLKSLQQNGKIKADEIEWTGLGEWLQMQPEGKIAKEAVLGFLEQNGVQVEEVMLGQGGASQEDLSLLAEYGLSLERQPDNPGIVAFMEPDTGDLVTAADIKGYGEYYPPEVAEAALRVEQAETGSGGNTARFQQYTLPGGEGYRELLLTLPKKEPPMLAELRALGITKDWGAITVSDIKKAGGSESLSDRWFSFVQSDRDFHSAHYDQPNILAHVRFDERTEASGERVLFVQELQSDWGQKGKREGFGQSRSKAIEAAQAAKSAMEEARRAGDPNWRSLLDEYNRLNAAVPVKDGVPAAPFVGKTDAWVALVLKRVMREAAERGISWVAWTTGAQQADRYDLSRQVRTIYYTPSKQLLRAVDHRADEVIMETGVTPEKLPDYIGKEAAEKIINNPTDILPSPWAPDVKMHTLEGVDLKLGGAGMKAFYDSIVPKVAKEVLKKLGGRPMEVVLEDDNGGKLRQPGVALSAEAMNKVLYEGQPLFSRGPDQTQTPEFKRWFGDSKVVDENGRPLRVYHGTREDFDAFDTEKGAHFGSSAQASMRATGGAKRLLPVYLAITNPKRVTDRVGWSQAVRKARAEGRDGIVYLNRVEGISLAEFEAARKRLRGAETLENISDSRFRALIPSADDSWIAFNPGQVKSAISNVGTFDPKNPDIRYSRGLGGKETNRYINGNGYAIIKNPTRAKALKMAEGDRYRELRMVVDDAGNVYIASASASLHDDIAESVGLTDDRGRYYGEKKMVKADAIYHPVYAKYWQDDPGDIRYSRGLPAQAQQAIDKAKQWAQWASPLGNLPRQDDYLKRRYRAQGSIARVDEIARGLFEAFKDAGDHAPRVFEYLTDASLLPSHIPDPDLRRKAMATKRLITHTGEQLVRTGLLRQETFEANRGAYLPRLYLTHLLKDSDIVAMGTGKKPSDMGYLKQRQDIPEDVRRLILGEIQDPGYLAAKGFGVQMRDVALIDWLSDLSQHADWVLPRSLVNWNGMQVTPFWLKAEAQIVNQIAENLEGQDQIDSRAIAAQMNAVADRALAGIGDVPKGWKQMPNTRRMGALRGLYVRAEIYDDIVGSTQINLGEVSRAEAILGNGGFLARANSWWKWPLALDTKIPTPSGWTTMGDIQVGDTVFDENGKSCDVLAVHEVLNGRDCYAVTFSDGTSITADGDHQWMVVDRTKGQQILSTIQIKDTLIAAERGDRRYSVPITKPLDLPPADLPLPPYALGVWLGDGLSGSARVCAWKDEAEELRSLLEKSGVKCGVGTVRADGLQVFPLQRAIERCLRNHDPKDARPNGSGCWACERERKANALSAVSNPRVPSVLRALGVFGDKHIPAIYLRASVGQRMELLRGLMDTDGTVEKTGVRCRFATSSARLRDDVLDLLRSLGYKPSYLGRLPTNNGKPGRPSWNIGFTAYADDPVFHLQRKASRLMPRPATTQRGSSRQIVSVTEVPSVPVRCISVSSESELFLAGDGFIPTHNCKVAANPPAQIRNIISNGVLLHLSGVPFHLVPKRVLQAISEIRHNGRFWQVAKKYGVTESTFASRELPRFDRELLELKRSTGGNPSWAAVVRLWGKLVDKTGDVYQFSEAIFKTAKIIDAMERESMSEGDAALAAQKGLFDYSLVQPSVRYLRNAPVGAPFATFAVKALPAMLDVAIHHPLRFAPYLALPVILTATVAAMADVDSDDVDKLKLALPDWLRERGHAYILPYKDAQGRWAFMDFGYFFPWTQWTELAGELARGEPGKAFQSTGMFGGPLPDLISAIQTNIDPFTRKPIVDPRDSTGQQLGAMMGYLYRMAMPTWLTDVGVAGKLREALTNQVDRYGDPKMTVPQALGRAVGINTYPVEPARSRADNLRRKQREISDVKRRMGERLRDRNLTHEDRQEIIQEYRAEMKERAAEYRDYAKESVVHPNLR